jgi:hypothetical protein
MTGKNKLKTKGQVHLEVCYWTLRFSFEAAMENLLSYLLKLAGISR